MIMWRAFVEHNPAARNLRLSVSDERGMRAAFLRQVVFEVPDDSWAASEPVQVEHGMIQAIVDAAYDAGIRPQKMDTAGVVAAQNGHITDLRKIAFKLAGIP